MTKRDTSLPALLLALLLPFGTVAMAADEAKKPTVDTNQLMKKLDGDKDGAVSKAEATQLKGLSEVFDSADESKDGKLDASELAKVMGAEPK